MIRLEQMRQHVLNLCTEHNIDCQFCAKRLSQAKAIYAPEHDLLEIWIAPIKSPISYATALHEIGHIRGRYQNRRRYGVLAREHWAWQWAREHALIWTPAMEAHAQASLAWYVPRAARIDRRERRWQHEEDARLAELRARYP